MDETTVRENLQEVRTRLAHIDEERDVLLSLIKGYEGLIRLQAASNGDARQIPMVADDDRPTRGPKPLGSVSLRAACVRVLREARGEPLHVKEIWMRAQILGAKTRSKNPHGVVELTCKGIPQAVRTQTRTWAWSENEAA